MRTKQKFNRNDLIFVVLVLVSIIALVNVFVLMSQYSSGTSEQALLMSSAYAEDAGGKFTKQINLIREKTSSVAAICATFDNVTDLDIYLDKMRHDDAYKTWIDDEIRYFYGDKEYALDCSLNEDNKQLVTVELAEVSAMRSNGVVATYGMIDDSLGKQARIACYCPITDSDIIDGIILYYLKDAVLSFVSDLDEEKLGYADLMAVCTQNNGELQVRAILADASGDVVENNSFYDAIESVTNDIATTNISSMIEKGVSDTQSIRLNGVQYIISVQRANPTDQGVYVIGLYKERTVYSSSYDLVETAIITMAIMFAVLFVFGIYFVVSRHRISKKLDQINMENVDLHCPTVQAFEREAKQIMTQNRGSTFAIVVSHVQHFAYIIEKHGEGIAQNILRHLCNIYASSLAEGETFGHIVDGEFALLLHYSDEKRLTNRLNSIFAVSRKHVDGDGIPDDYDLKMLFGIYKVDRFDQPVQKMLDKAISVCDMPSRTDINQICTFYDDASRNTYMRKAEIENRMESALANGEFRVFYQPKYNLDDDRIDGAELLVRWYDPQMQTYRSPAEFLPVFEENGFISKLDRHIYYTACETLAKWIEEGRRIFPISVNISRVTAIQSDFLAYYIKVKKHFNIADNFITLEFTESFAYENYEYLSYVAKELRKAGFLCSIDDFGTGYSTYNVLKLLEMDEIKLDKFFLDKGVYADVDRLILDSVITMGKRMKLKVTQEGVETLEDLEMLREEGCNVIQGYYFARPMSGNDYLEFIDKFFKENPILKAERELREGKEAEEKN